MKQCGKVLLATAAYQIVAVGMCQAQPQTPPVDSGQNKLSLSAAPDQSLSPSVPQVLQFASSVPDVGPGRCVNPRSPPSGGSSGYSGYTTPSYTGPSAAELAAQQRRQEATKLNQQGIAYWNNRQWHLAADAFKAALEKNPTSTVIRSNYEKALAEARSEDAAKEAERKRQQQETAAAQNMRRILQQSGSQIGSTAPAGSGLDFMRQGSGSGSPDKQQAGGTETGQKPTGGLDFMKPGDRSASLSGAKKALDQANTINIDTRAGMVGDDFASKVQSGKTFDDPTRIVSSGIKPVVDLSGSGQPVAYPEAVKKDAKFIQLQKEQADLQSKYQAKEAELAQVRKEMETAPPEKKGELAIKAVGIKADMTAAEYGVGLKEKEKQARAKLVIDTTVEQSSDTNKKGGQTNPGK